MTSQSSIFVLNVVSVVSAKEGGGNAERIVQLCRSMSALDVQSAVLSLDIGDTETRRMQLGDVDLIVLPCLNRRLQLPWPKGLQILKLIRKSDVVHLMGYWSLLGFLVALFSVYLKVPYVICPAGALPVYGRSKILKFIFNQTIGHWLIAHASGWIAVTPRELPDFLKYGVSSNLVKIIPNGVTESAFLYNSKISFRNSYKIKSAPFVLFMGRLNSIKGPDILLESFIQISSEFPSVHLVFAGPDEGLRDYLEKRVKSLCLEMRIHFIGFLDEVHKVAAYHEACLLVVPSRSEAMSLVAIESGICGTPVLITDQCGLDDVKLIHENLVVPSTIGGVTYGLRFALSDLDRLRTWGQHWKTLVQKRFLWEDLTSNFLNYLKALTREDSM